MRLRWVTTLLQVPDIQRGIQSTGNKAAGISSSGQGIMGMDVWGMIVLCDLSHSPVEALKRQRINTSIMGPQCRSSIFIWGYRAMSIISYSIPPLSTVEAKLGRRSERAQELRRLESSKDIGTDVAGGPLEEQLIHSLQLKTANGLLYSEYR